VEGLAIILLVPIIVPLSEALGVALADAEGLAIILLAPIICELSIICPLGIIC
jgi:hypothetical protein